MNYILHECIQFPIVFLIYGNCSQPQFWKLLLQHRNSFYRVPQEDPSGNSLVIPAADFMRIRDAALVLTDDERKYAAEDAKRRKEQQQVSSWCFIILFTQIPNILIILYLTPIVRSNN